MEDWGIAIGVARVWHGVAFRGAGRVASYDKGASGGVVVAGRCGIMWRVKAGVFKNRVIMRHRVAFGLIGGWFGGLTITLNMSAKWFSAIVAAVHWSSRSVGRCLDLERAGSLYLMVLGCHEGWQGAAVRNSGRG